MIKVLIIAEDPTIDQHILEPVVERIFSDLNRKARVEALKDPHLGGVAQALNPDQVREIIADNPMEDLFLLMVDRDGDASGNATKAAARVAENQGKLLACVAVEEVEVWMLALHREKLDASWQEIRGHRDPKERYSDPFLRAQGWLSTVGRGRKRAMSTLGARWSGLLTVCPEIDALKQDVAAWLRSRA